MQDPQAFIDDMASIFDGLDLTDIAAHTSEIMQSMMEKIRNHQVRTGYKPTIIAYGTQHTNLDDDSICFWWKWEHCVSKVSLLAI